MKNFGFRALNSLAAIAKRVTVVLIGVVMLLSLTQTAVMAANNPEKTRLGAPNTESIRDKDNGAAKAKRQEWQRKASSVREDKQNKPETLGEKLNVDELEKGYHPKREAEKRSVPTP